MLEGLNDQVHDPLSPFYDIYPSPPPSLTLPYDYLPFTPCLLACLLSGGGHPVSTTDKPRQTLLFSATFSREVREIAASFLRQGYQVVDTVGEEVEQTHEHVTQVGAVQCSAVQRPNPCPNSSPDLMQVSA